EHERPSRLHRDDPPVEREDRGAEPQKDAAQACAAAALADKRRLPDGVHIRRQREQGLLRAGAPRPLQARIREAGPSIAKRGLAGSRVGRSNQQTSTVSSLRPSVTYANV